MNGFAEWTFEGSFEIRRMESRKLGTDGNHDRYLVAHMLVCEGSGHFANLSGTADDRIRLKYRITVFEAFFILQESPCPTKEGRLLM